MLLVVQRKNRLLQLKPLNASTKAALLSAFKNTVTQPSPAFGLGQQQTSSFGVSTATAGGFGTPGFSGFGGAAAVNSSSTTTPLPAFGAFNAAAATSASPSSGALFGQTASASGHAVTSASAAVTNTTASEKLFTPKSELSAEEWQQFEAKEFTIGKIPLKPPPSELLNAYDLLSLFRSHMF